MRKLFSLAAVLLFSGALFAQYSVPDTYAGTGSPEGHVKAHANSIYTDVASGAVYQKSQGDETTGWVSVPSNSTIPGSADYPSTWIAGSILDNTTLNQFKIAASAGSLAAKQVPPTLSTSNDFGVYLPDGNAVSMSCLMGSFTRTRRDATTANKFATIDTTSNPFSFAIATGGNGASNGADIADTVVTLPDNLVAAQFNCVSIKTHDVLTGGTGYITHITDPASYGTQPTGMQVSAIMTCKAY